MNFKNPFRNLFVKNTIASTENSHLQSESSTDNGWEDLASMNSDSQSTSFDSLSEVPFAGDTSVTDFSVTPEQRLADDLEIAGIAAGESPVSIDSEQQGTISSPEVQAFKNFFKTNLRIKRELIQAAPSLADDYDEASRMDYVESAYRTFKDFRPDFAAIERDFHFSPNISEQTDAFFARGVEHFVLDRYDFGITNEIYRKEFTDLRRDFVEKVKDECVGYKLFGSLDSLISSSKTINELLHAYHSYIMNNEQILQGVPDITHKDNNYGCTITLRGDKSGLSQQVFNAIPSDLDIGTTDIIAAGENIMMMVRDRGHALTISAEPDHSKPDQIWVEYNVPKLCNVEMIKALPGLDGYSENGARGRFIVSKGDLGDKIAKFIAQVPTDSDMSSPGGVLYQPASSHP